MARTVPSTIVQFIDTAFPWAKAGRLATTAVGRNHRTQLLALIGLLDQLPQELLVLNPADHAAYVMIQMLLEDARHSWDSRNAHPVGTLPLDGNPNPIGYLRELLDGCPDEFPAAQDAALAFVTDDHLRMDLERDVASVSRALADGEWKAATVLAGAAAEALLLWAFESAAPLEQQHAVEQLRAKTKAVSSDPKEWGLDLYIQAALQLKIIRTETGTALHLARTFRNFIHPGRSARTGLRCDRATALSAAAGLHHAIRDLTP